MEALRNSFYSDAQDIDFAQSESAAKVGHSIFCIGAILYMSNTPQKINGWVEKKTRNKIKDLINPLSLDPDSRFVLINAIYFKATWKYQFVKSKTRSKMFNTEVKIFDKRQGMQSKKVQMMDLTETFEFADLPSLQSTMLRLPYEGERIVLDILLPNQIRKR